MSDPRPRDRGFPRRGFGFPLALIAVGLVVLLANYGLLGPVSWLSLLALWPLILVLIGIDLLLAHRAPVLALAGDVAVIVLGLALVLTQPSWIGVPAFSFSGTDCGGADRSTSVSAPRDGAKSVGLHLAAGATRLNLSGGASGLLEASSTEPDLRLLNPTPRAPGVVLRLDQCLRSSFGRGETSQMSVKVANDVPLSLDVSAGAATMDVDLRDVAVTDVRISAGATTLNLFLPKPSGDLRVAVSSGASTINVQLPPGVESRVTLSGGLSTLNGGGGIFAARNATESPGYAAAKDRVTVTVSAGLSTVNVR